MVDEKSPGDVWPRKILRKRTRSRLVTSQVDISKMTTGEVHEFMHNLQQADLERQNEVLREAWFKPGDAPDGNADVIDIAAGGLLTSKEQRGIQPAHLTSASMLRKYESLFQNEMTGNYVARPDGTLLLCNAAFAHIFGFASMEDALKSNLADVLEARESWPIILDELRRNKKIHRRERSTFRQDGAPIHVVESTLGLFNDYQELIEIHGYVFDDTERKQAEAALRESEERFRQVFEHAATGISITDLRGRIQQCNPALSTLLGYTVEELLRTDFPSLIHPDDREANVAEVRRLLAGEINEFEIENRYVHKGGPPVWVRKFVSCLPDENGNPAHLMALVTDVTERKKAEEVLRKLNESLEQQVAARTAEAVATSKRLQAILDTSFSAIITIDQGGTIQTANPAAERMFGYDVHELVGQNVEILAPPPYREEIGGYITRYVATSKPNILGKSREVLAQRADGTVFPAELAVSAIDHTNQFAGVIRDITERKLLQQRMIEVAEEEQRRFGQELHDVIGQELTGLSMFASTLSSLLGDPPQEEGDGHLDALRADADGFKIRRIVSRLSQGLVEANRHVHELARGIMPVQVDAQGLNSALEELAASTSAQYGILCRFECISPVEITSNSTATNLYRIAKEAVNNALEHGRGDQIDISVAQSKSHVILEVHDNGVGFDPTSTPDADRKPSGMGLQIMHCRASVINGVLQIDSQRGTGTVVRCSISRKGDSHGD